MCDAKKTRNRGAELEDDALPAKGFGAIRYHSFTHYWQGLVIVIIDDDVQYIADMAHAEYPGKDASQ